MEQGSPAAIQGLAWALAAKGMEREALAGIKDYCRIVYGMRDVDVPFDRWFAEGGFAGATRRGADALALRAAQGGALPFDVAHMYLFAGEKTLALDWLERAYEARDPALPYLRLPIFDPLRSEPRFQALMRRMGLPQD